MYDGNFDDVLKEAEAKYQEKKKVYGESWKTKSLCFLQERLHEECKELLWAESEGEIHKEALDVINLALMVAKRTQSDYDTFGELWLKQELQQHPNAKKI